MYHFTRHFLIARLESNASLRLEESVKFSGIGIVPKGAKDNRIRNFEGFFCFSRKLRELRSHFYASEEGS
jgi:hypothetical protein